MKHLLPMNENIISDGNPYQKRVKNVLPVMGIRGMKRLGDFLGYTSRRIDVNSALAAPVEKHLSSREALVSTFQLNSEHLAIRLGFHLFWLDSHTCHEGQVVECHVFQLSVQQHQLSWCRPTIVQ